MLLADTAFAAVTTEALRLLGESSTQTALPVVVDLVDPIPVHAALGECVGRLTYEELVASGDSAFEWRVPLDEWDTQASDCFGLLSGWFRLLSVVSGCLGLLLSASRRVRRAGNQLHERHDRTAQGRALSPPWGRPQRDQQCAHLGHGGDCSRLHLIASDVLLWTMEVHQTPAPASASVGASPAAAAKRAAFGRSLAGAPDVPVDAAHVPLQRLDVPVHDHDAGGHASVPPDCL